MTIEYIPQEPMGLQVIAAWKAQGIGVPDVLASGHRLMLPIWRHSERMDPLVIDMGCRASARVYRAVVTDRDVIKALWASHAHECIGEFAWSEGLYVEHEDDGYSPSAFAVEDSDPVKFARGVWLLHFFSQRLLDFAEGVAVGTPIPQVPKFNPDALVKSITGLTMGPKLVGVS